VNIPPEIKKLLAEKRKARAKWQRTHTPSDKTTFNRPSSILKSQLNVMRTFSFKNYVSTLSRYDNSTWKPIKSSRKPTLESPPLRLETLNQERWAKSDKEKAAVFAKQLADVFQPHELTKKCLNSWNYQHNQLNPQNITQKEMHYEIELFNAKKVSDMDLITPKMLNELPRKGVILLAYLFNAILRHQYWPHKLKLAEIILIPKPGKDPKEVKILSSQKLITDHRKTLRKTDPPQN